MFGDEKAIIRFDMSEYMEKHTISRLIGSPPGYVGYDEGGQLTEAVRRKPYSVILFDEIEKAHPDIFNVLLQILDDGRVTDSKGKNVYFKNTVIILTSNVGARALTENRANFGFTVSGSGNDIENYEKNKEIVMSELKNLFKPEFLNRIDDIIVFHKLSQDDCEKIAKIMLQQVTDKLHNIGLSVEFTDNAVKSIAKKGYDPVYGARPLKRVIQDQIEDKIAEKMLEKLIEPDRTYIIDYNDDMFTFTQQ